MRRALADATHATAAGDDPSVRPSLVAELVGREREFAAILARWQTARTEILGQRKAVIPPPFVDERGDPRAQPIAEERVECRPEERVDAALQVEQEHQRVVDPVEHAHAEIGVVQEWLAAS